MLTRKMKNEKVPINSKTVYTRTFVIQNARSSEKAWVLKIPEIKRRIRTGSPLNGPADISELKVLYIHIEFCIKEVRVYIYI